MSGRRKLANELPVLQPVIVRFQAHYYDGLVVGHTAGGRPLVRFRTGSGDRVGQGQERTRPLDVVADRAAAEARHGLCCFVEAES